MTSRMDEDNFDIKLKEHYKLYVLLKDQIIFENELKKRGIRYYSNINEQSSIDGGLRYFFLDIDMQRIDQLLIETGIVATTESLMITDFSFQKNISKMLILVIGVFLGITILVVIIGKIID